LSYDCIFAPSQVRLHQIGGKYRGVARQERVVDWSVRDDDQRGSAGRRYTPSGDAGKRSCRGFHISFRQYQVHDALHETPNLSNTSFSFVCFVDRAALCNLVNKTNLVHSFCYYAYLFSLHVSGDYVPIIKRNNFIYATLGICYSLWMTVWYAGWNIYPDDE